MVCFVRMLALLVLVIAVGCDSTNSGSPGGGGPNSGGSGGAGGAGSGGVDRERVLWEPGAPAFTVEGDTVADARSGLVWERNTSSSSLAYAAAVSRCDDLVLGGQDDWRLPTLAELNSIVDPTVVDPAIDEAAFPETPSVRFWTDTQFRDLEDGGFVVNFMIGETGSEGRDDHHRARCVRSGKDARPGFDVTDDVARDSVSGLRWQRGESPRASTFAEAAAWCDGLAAGGETDWRLPTLHELATLVVPEQAEPTADLVAFPDVRPEGYWTSTPFAPGGGEAHWAVSFGGEFPCLLVLSDPAQDFFETGPHVRCVR